MVRAINDNGNVKFVDSQRQHEFLNGFFDSEKEGKLFLESLTEPELARWLSGKPVFLLPREKRGVKL